MLAFAISSQHSSLFAGGTLSEFSDTAASSIPSLRRATGNISAGNPFGHRPLKTDSVTLFLKLRITRAALR
jgi:hypothetical protein